MVITRFHVTLEQEDAVYVSGSTIRGKLEVTADEDTECREIMMRAKGWATLSFILSRAQEKPDTNEEYFLDQAVTVWQGSELGAILKKGEYILPFKFIIPPNCPPTFKGDCGKIKYKIEGYAGSPWDPPSVCEIKFTMVEPYDLNEDRDARTPLRITSEETVCCGCCSTGPVTISLSAPKSGYCPGEELILYGEIVNGTKMKIKDITIKIIQRTIYKAKNGNQKKEKSIIKRVELPGIPARQSQPWSGGKITIPDDVIGMLKSSNIIDNEYYLQITPHFFVKSDNRINAWFNICQSISTEVPIVIGSIPLKGPKPPAEKCGICSQVYFVPNEASPLLTCDNCGHGSHDTCVLTKLDIREDEKEYFSPSQARDKISPTGLPGVHYLCKECEGSLGTETAKITRKITSEEPISNCTDKELKSPESKEKDDINNIEKSPKCETKVSDTTNTTITSDSTTTSTATTTAISTTTTTPGLTRKPTPTSIKRVKSSNPSHTINPYVLNTDLLNQSESDCLSVRKKSPSIDKKGSVRKKIPLSDKKLMPISNGDKKMIPRSGSDTKKEKSPTLHNERNKSPLSDNKDCPTLFKNETSSLERTNSKNSKKSKNSRNTKMRSEVSPTSQPPKTS